MSTATITGGKVSSGRKRSRSNTIKDTATTVIPNTSSTSTSIAAVTKTTKPAIILNNTTSKLAAAATVGTSSASSQPKQRAKIEKIEDALPKEIPKQLSFCFPICNNKNFKKLYRCAWPEISLTLCPAPEDDGCASCLVCEVLDKYFTHLYSRPEHVARVHRTYRQYPMQSPADDDDTWEDCEEAHGVYMNQDPADSDWQQLRLNLSLPSDTPNRLPKEQREWIAAGQLDKVRQKDGISLINRIKKHLFNLKKITPLKHQQEMIDYLKDHDFSGNTVEHYPPFLLYWSLGSGIVIEHSLYIVNNRTQTISQSISFSIY